jgi:hypothetical protein
MSCEHCVQWLQEVLDGAEPDLALIEHLVTCPACRDLYESALALRKGLAEMPRPEPTPELTDRVVSAVLFDRKRRQRRRRTFARIAALAASILVVLFVSKYRPGPEPTLKPAAVENVKAPSLRKTVVEAGSIVVERTRKQVDEAIDSTMQLLRRMEGDPPPASAVDPLQEASQGMTASLEPMTGSARRAFALFVRDLSPGPRSKPGS